MVAAQFFRMLSVGASFKRVSPSPQSTAISPTTGPHSEVESSKTLESQDLGSSKSDNSNNNNNIPRLAWKVESKEAEVDDPPTAPEAFCSSPSVRLVWNITLGTLAAYSLMLSGGALFFWAEGQHEKTVACALRADENALRMTMRLLPITDSVCMSM